MEFSIIVPVFNRPGYTKTCLDSLVAHTDLSTAEIIVVDNGSIGPTKRVLSTYSNIRVIQNESNLGAATAQNQGIKAASGKVIVFLHNDCIVNKTWMTGLRATAKALESSPKIKAASPFTNYADEVTFVYSKHLQAQFIKHKLFNKTNPTPDEIKAVVNKVYPGTFDLIGEETMLMKPPLERVDEISAFCMIAKKSLFSEAGYFEEQFKFRGCEEKDLMSRIQFMGNEVGRAGFFVHHFGNITSDGPGFCWQDMIRINKEIYNGLLRNYAGIKADEKWSVVVFPDSLHPELTARAISNIQALKNIPVQIIQIPQIGIFPERKAWEWALPQIESEFVMHLDSDMLLSKSAPDILMRNFSNPDIACVAGMLEDPCVGKIGHLRLWRTRVLKQIITGEPIRDILPDSGCIQAANKLGWAINFIPDIVGEHAVVLEPWNVFRMYFRRGLKQKARGRIGTPAGTWSIDGALQTGSNWSHIALLGFHCGIMAEYDSDPHDAKFDEYAYSHYKKVKDFAEGLVEVKLELPSPEKKEFDKINVALLSDTLDIGGMEMFIKLFDQYADKNKFNISVYSRTGGPLESELNCKIRLAPGPNDITSGKIFKWLCDDRIDVVILITYSKAALVFAHGKICRIIERLDGAHVVLLNDPKLSDVVVFQSSKLADIQREKYPGIRHALIENGRDLERFKLNWPTRIELRKRLGVAENYVLFCNVGRLTHAKHQSNLIEMAAVLRETHQNFKLVIMGPDQGEGPALEKMIQARGLQKYVLIMNGTVDGTASLYSAADVYIQASRFEGLSGALIEAVAAGLPIIATNVGATADVIDERNGILIPPLEVAPLIAGADKMFDATLRARMGIVSLQRSSKYCAKEMVKKYEALITEEYEAAVKERAALPPTTIIIPVYNRAEFLDMAIESVLNQTSDEWRLVVAIDTLTPNADILEILGRYKDPRISHVKFPHKNQCSVLNHAVKQIRTVYSSRLDSDDKYAPNAIELLNKHIRENPDIGYFYTSRKHINSQDGFIDKLDITEDFSPLRLEQWYISRGMLTWKNSEFVRAGGFAEDIVYGEDYLLPLTMMLHGTKFMPIKEELCYIREHPESRISSSHSTHEQKFYVNLVRERYQKLKKLMKISWAGEDPSTMQPRMRVPGQVGSC